MNLVKRIRVGGLVVMFVYWGTYQALHTFVIERFPQFHELIHFLLFAIPLLIVGQIIVILDERNSEKVARVEHEKQRIYDAGLFGNNKEVRNHAIIIGQAVAMAKNELINNAEAFEMVSKHAKQIVEVLDCDFTNLNDETSNQAKIDCARKDVEFIPL